MYPPKVTDGEVRSLIASLAKGENLPSGRAVRAALLARTGHRGGVARIYRLLEAERRARDAERSIVAPKAESAELNALQAQLIRAQAYADDLQSHWAREIDQLRQRVLYLEPLAREAAVLKTQHEDLHRQLRAAELRAGRLETELVARDAVEAGERHTSVAQVVRQDDGE